MEIFKKLTEEEKLCRDLLYSEYDIILGDKRLNNIAALTYNIKSCDNIFIYIEKGLSITECTWKTIYKSLLLLHTIILYGSEIAIDKSILLTRYLPSLIIYNSALIKKGYLVSGGIDMGAPVRNAAKELDNILKNDNTIRQARYNARINSDSLVPLGNSNSSNNNSNEEALYNPAKNIINGNSNNNSNMLTYGQGINSSIGAGYSLHDVPGMHE
jgi:hypothetical protein